MEYIVWVPCSLVPCPGIEPMPLALEGGVFKHWTVGEVPRLNFHFLKICGSWVTLINICSDLGLPFLHPVHITLPSLSCPLVGLQFF